jgi:hypothetical protein
MNAVEHISDVFTTALQVPKLDVAGSSPVSRSITSITYKSRNRANERNQGSKEVRQPDSMDQKGRMPATP